MFNDLVAELLPELHEKLLELGLTEMLALSWFLTVFLNAVNFQAAVRILDCFFHDGARSLCRSSSHISTHDDGDPLTAPSDTSLPPTTTTPNLHHNSLTTLSWKSPVMTRSVGLTREG